MAHRSPAPRLHHREHCDQWPSGVGSQQGPSPSPTGTARLPLSLPRETSRTHRAPAPTSPNLIPCGSNGTMTPGLPGVAGAP